MNLQKNANRLLFGGVLHFMPGFWALCIEADPFARCIFPAGWV
ncbi:hypothetical protein [uncultured Subdoligranulum sp.]|nr:hypothetical protein [uncultured Subdoligranulum sp.]